MGVEGVKNFAEKLATDEALGNELGQILKDGKGADQADAVIALGARHGCEFNREECLQLRNVISIRIKQQADLELSEEELEMVAGGGDWANHWMAGYSQAHTGDPGGSSFNLGSDIWSSDAWKDDVKDFFSSW